MFFSVENVFDLHLLCGSVFVLIHILPGSTKRVPHHIERVLYLGWRMFLTSMLDVDQSCALCATTVERWGAGVEYHFQEIS